MADDGYVTQQRDLGSPDRFLIKDQSTDDNGLAVQDADCRLSGPAAEPGDARFWIYANDIADLDFDVRGDLVVAARPGQDLQTHPHRHR